jgi:hypothetical protein
MGLILGVIGLASALIYFFLSVDPTRVESDIS